MEILFEWAREEPYQISSDVALESTRLVESDTVFTKMPHIDAVLARTKDHYELSGRILATLLVPCARCLENYTIGIAREIRLMLFPRPAYPAFVEIELNDKDMDTSFYSEEKVVLEDLVSEQINLELPMRPLCRPDCRGLCPTCGADLNGGQCTCR